MDPPIGWVGGFTTSKGVYLLRRCKSCGEDKLESEFYKSGRDGLQYRCKVCSNATVKKWRAENPERSRGHVRRQRHGVDMVADGSCDICGDEATVVDHDHACCGPRKTCVQCRRGVLCRGCNLAIGHLRDDPALARAAAEYLEAWNGLDA